MFGYPAYERIARKLDARSQCTGIEVKRLVPANEAWKKCIIRMIGDA
jgi:hypothetical protein